MVYRTRKYRKRRSRRNRRGGKKTSKRSVSRRYRRQTGGGCGCNTSPKIEPTEAFVGDAWTPSPATWPGVAGVEGVTNHYAPNKSVVDPPAPARYFLSPDGGRAVGGGRRRRYRRLSRRLRKGGRKQRRSRRRRSRRGQRGGAIFQDLTNLGRSVEYGVKSVAAGFAGERPPVNPSPLEQPIGADEKLLTSKLPNVPKIYRTANESVAKI